MRLAQPVRAFVLERLGEEEHRRLRARHAETYRSLAAARAPRLFGPVEQATLDRFQVESDNLRAAFGRSRDGNLQRLRRQQAPVCGLPMSSRSGRRLATSALVDTVRRNGSAGASSESSRGADPQRQAGSVRARSHSRSGPTQGRRICLHAGHQFSGLAVTCTTRSSTRCRRRRSGGPGSVRSASATRSS